MPGFHKDEVPVPNYPPPRATTVWVIRGTALSIHNLSTRGVNGQLLAPGLFILGESAPLYPLVGLRAGLDPLEKGNLIHSLVSKYV